MLNSHTVEAVHHETKLQLAKIAWIHHWTILELENVHIAPSIASYVNGQSNYFNCFICTIVTILKVKNKSLGDSKPLNTATSYLGFSWDQTGLEQLNLDLGTRLEHKWSEIESIFNIMQELCKALAFEIQS